MQSHSREDVAKIIFDKYNEVFGTPTIQILPGGVARITFKEAVAKQNLLRHDKISLDGRSCKIFADRRLVWVQVHHYPSEAFDSAIEEFFMSYGTVKQVKRQHWVALPDVQTGTRLVGILLDKQVPRNVIISGFNCKTWYRGQPVTCDLCGEEGHVLSNCPIRGKCRRCREPGHFAKDCSRSPWKAPPSPAPASESGVDPTPAEASTPLVSPDLRDNQLDELDSQSVFADALSSAASSESSGDEVESENGDVDFETEEEVEEEVDEAESEVDAPASVGDVDGSDSTLDGHPSNVNVNESVVPAKGSKVTAKQCISKGTTKQRSSINHTSVVNSESTPKQDIGINSQSITKLSTSKQSVNDNGVAAQQDSRTTSDHGVAAQQDSHGNNGVAAKQDPRAINDNGVAAEQDSRTANDNGVAAKQDSRAISDNGVAAKQDSRTTNDNGVAAKQDSRTANDNGVAAKQDSRTVNDNNQKPSNNTSVNSEDEMEYKSVQGNKRPAADDGSSDEPTPSWEDVVVSEEVVDAAARFSAAQVPALRKKSKPPLNVSRKVLSVAGRVAADDSLFKANRPRRRPPKQS